MRVVVTGGRKYGNAGSLFNILNGTHLDRPISLLAHGGASGADRLASRWAAANGVPEACFPAHWEKLGNGAGPRRNRWMLDTIKPDLVIAFPGGTGTAQCVFYAEKLGIVVERVAV